VNVEVRKILTNKIFKTAIIAYKFQHNFHNEDKNMPISNFECEICECENFL
jgi:hypothetical protein